MASMQRKNYDLRSGKTSSNSCSGHARRKPKILIKPGSPKRRTFNTILNSGAYTREKFVPEHPKVDREAAKMHLQDLMAYGKELKPKSSRGAGKNEKSRVKEVGGQSTDNAGNRFDQSKYQNRVTELQINKCKTCGIRGRKTCFRLAELVALDLGSDSNNFGEM